MAIDLVGDSQKLHFQFFPDKGSDGSDPVAGTMDLEFYSGKTQLIGTTVHTSDLGRTVGVAMAREILAMVSRGDFGRDIAITPLRGELGERVAQAVWSEDIEPIRSTSRIRNRREMNDFGM